MKKRIKKWGDSLVIVFTKEECGLYGLVKGDMLELDDIFMRNDNLRNNTNLKNTARIQTLKRTIHSIKTLIRNTKIAIKSEDKEGFDDHTKRLDKILKAIPLLKLKTKRGNKIIELNLDENLFEKITQDLDNIMDDIHVKINKAGLS